MNERLKKIESNLVNYITKNYSNEDKSHDLSHFKRVWKLCHKMASVSDDLEILMASAYLHDIVSYPKNHPDRALSSTHAAQKAKEILQMIGFPSEKLDQVAHCIESHSFSANIPPETNEAKILQDADRMESLGAIGLARTFYVASKIGSSLFDPIDPMANKRQLDDKKYALDHFETKLLRLPSMMQTQAGKLEATKRAQIMINFREQLLSELSYL